MHILYMEGQACACFLRPVVTETRREQGTECRLWPGSELEDLENNVPSCRELVAGGSNVRRGRTFKIRPWAGGKEDAREDGG